MAKETKKTEEKVKLTEKELKELKQAENKKRNNFYASFEWTKKREFIISNFIDKYTLFKENDFGRKETLNQLNDMYHELNWFGDDKSTVFFSFLRWALAVPGTNRELNEAKSELEKIDKAIQEFNSKTEEIANRLQDASREELVFYVQSNQELSKLYEKQSDIVSKMRRAEPTDEKYLTEIKNKSIKRLNTLIKTKLGDNPKFSMHESIFYYFNRALSKEQKALFEHEELETISDQMKKLYKATTKDKQTRYEASDPEKLNEWNDLNNRYKAKFEELNKPAEEPESQDT